MCGEFCTLPAPFLKTIFNFPGVPPGEFLRRFARTIRALAPHLTAVLSDQLRRIIFQEQARQLLSTFGEGLDVC
jgi:hypothetical protein